MAKNYYLGMNRTTGKALSGTTHLAQSINDILTTRIGRRVERREYGSNLPDRIDYPTNPAMLSLVYSDVALALMTWEPRLKLSRVQLFRTGGINSGQLQFVIEGKNLLNEEVKIEVRV